MTEKEYRQVWEETNKAFNYLRKKGCMFLSDTVPSGFGPALLIKYQVSDASEKMRQHVSRAYPNALVEYVDRATVVYGELERQKAFAEYRMSL